MKAVQRGTPITNSLASPADLRDNFSEAQVTNSEVEININEYSKDNKQKESGLFLMKK